jgi:UDP-3-O-[3-hydroxymyristoyl] N-acetylglucosamine deacetylase
MDMQRTLKKTVAFSGIGLHTGREASVKILPSAANTGITFVRKDLPGSPEIKALASNVVDTAYATTIGDRGATVATVEHLMAAFYGLGVDNAVVEVSGPEVPIMDGSAVAFVELIEAAGLRELDSPRKRLVIKRATKVSDGDRHLLALPPEDDGLSLSIDYSIDFAHSLLTRQSFSGSLSGNAFKTELGSARTFGFLRDVETMRANGLAKGGSLSNAVVIADSEILNAEGLRYPDEFVRHKVLDLMGDLALAGMPVVGRIVARRSGHSLNLSLVKELARRPGRCEVLDPAAPRATDDIRAERPLILDKLAIV